MQKLKPFGDIFGEAWAIYKNQFWVLVNIASVPAVIFFLSSYLFSINIMLTILVYLAGFVFSFASGLALIYAIKDKTDFMGSYKKAFAGFWAYGWIVFLIMIITMGGFFMGVIPGIIFSIFFIFSAYTFIFEGDKGLDALLKSREYVRNYWWDIWWKIFLMGLVTSVPFLLFAPFELFMGYKAAATQQVVSGPAQEIIGAIKQLVGIIIVPLAVAFALSLYHNLTQVKPELVGKKIEAKKGFWIFAAIWGVVAPTAVMIIGMVFFAAYFYESLNSQPDAYQNQFFENYYPQQ